ncbi:Thioredoxin-like fold protein [Cordyceps fumosorosea ARSEF 2679]|uniref:Thioredoxin-like fold protein n=1 Tax=Cordyceps fumosorosea (strain ARSEF 2679) TaxID=1081104 RepID=A0A167SYR4_CORFA|nr:Thioredoxin-like fold protein [Cordyceps fumosorosea ARSEF 2679]OAA60070.1 Thioredoxin-like fold protein [Cordyceps fumosorosea ARSEF 2679]
MAAFINNSDAFTLHMFPFSLYSIMVMYTYVLGKQDASEDGGISLSYNLINLHRDENISEEYLAKINPKGLVPTLTGGSLSQPMPESLDISYWLCSHFPHLLPEPNEAKIRKLLADIHAIQGLCLSIDKGDRMEKVPCDADEALERDDLRLEYRRALEYKQRIETLETALTDGRVQEAEGQARDLFRDVVAVYNPSDDCILGNGPTVLDGHLVPFIVRLLDCKREDLVPEALQKYARKHAASPQWNRVMHGRPTRWNVSLGHVSDMAGDYTGPQ